MAEQDPALQDSLMRLAAVPTQHFMTREQWLQKFARINLRSIVAVAPEATAYNLDASWALVRVGSFWREDEEYHVYAMEHSVLAMIENKRVRPSADMLIVTPIWVFCKSGSRAIPASNEGILRIAEQNFMRFFNELYKRYQANG